MYLITVLTRREPRIFVELLLGVLWDLMAKNLVMIAVQNLKLYAALNGMLHKI